MQPICVDLDCTLLRTDTLWESFIQLLQHKPYLVPVFGWHLLRSRARGKNYLAQAVSLNVETLPYNDSVLAFLKSEKAKGRTLFLITGAHSTLAHAVAKHLNLFDGVAGTTNNCNLTGCHKAKFLVNKFGKQSFDYLGDSRKDLPVWANARLAHLANCSSGLVRSVEKVAKIGLLFPRQEPALLALVQVLRPHQWVKNLLLFLPMLTAHIYGHGTAWLTASAAFVSFSLLASSIYVLNDLFDLEADRRHPKKQYRALASGRLPITTGLLVWPVLLLGSLIIGYALSLHFLLILLLYLCGNLTYSLLLKRIPIADALCLAGFYTLRIFAGAEATAVEVSSWLLLFSIFFFLSLGLAKRYTELYGLSHRQLSSAPGRGYHTEDLEFIANLGASSGYLSVLVFALYISSPKVASLYVQGTVLWLLCFLLLYWLGRLWLITHRGQLHHDPVVFALRDKVSYFLAALCVVVFILAHPR